MIGCAVVLAACGSGSVTAPPTISNQPDPTADRIYIESTQLDYSAPRDRSARDKLRARAVAAYAAACDRGDHRSCWRAAEVAFGRGYDDKLVQRAAIATANACLGGDDRSCDALIAVRTELIVLSRTNADDHEARALCERGLAGACGAVADHLIDLGPMTPEARALYERACKLGDSASCFALGVSADTDPNPFREREHQAARAECARGMGRGCRFLAEFDESFRQRAAEVLLAGCRDGMIYDCLGIATPREPKLRDEMLRIICPVRGDGCEQLAKLHAADGPLPDRTAERDALEQGCQWTSTSAFLCALLVEKYDKHEHVEPVPHQIGRAHV